jgi:TonB-dependent SusC/RagA subfamily outer membrane receptor
MKKIIIFFFTVSICSTLLLAQQPIDVKSEISEVTVYQSGALISRKATFKADKGKFILRLTKLAPYIVDESIKVDGDGSFTILNVQFRNDFLNTLERDKKIEDLIDSLDFYTKKIEESDTWTKILNERLEFLKSNQNISGKQEATDLTSLRSLDAYYSDNLQKINMDLLKQKRLKADYNDHINKINNELNSVRNNRPLPSGTIEVTVEKKSSQAASLTTTYRVANASWYPSYDIRFAGTKEPVHISYKANIIQNTGVDWKDVDIVLSNAQAHISGQIPEINPWYLSYYVPDITSALQGRAAGVNVIQSAPSAPAMEMEKSSIRIRGAETLDDKNPLYVIDGVPQDGPRNLRPDEIASVNVLKDAAATSVYGSRASNGVVVITTKKGGSGSTPLSISYKNETSIEFTIDSKQTILSNNQQNTFVYKTADLNAIYEFQSVPKLSEKVYLIGKLYDWYTADLVDGEANIYMENSYVGKSQINTAQFSDTLDISFGIDNNIIVDREKLKDFSESKFIGTNKRETISWKISVRNNKSYPVALTLTDQIPITTSKDIVIEPGELTGGKLDETTGGVTWELNLNPNETSELIMSYSVRYPKNKRIVLE